MYQQEAHENNNPKILIVDDEKDITTIFKSGIERQGFSVTTFNDPLEAFSQYLPGNFDLVLLDISMPKMSGFELYKELKKKDPNLKACFVTAYEMWDKNSLDEDYPRIISKPISMKELIKIIEEEISNKLQPPVHNFTKL